jgi:DNA-binding MarR family transcriptional regulator
MANTSGTSTTTDIRAFRAALRILVRKIGRQLRDDTQCCGVGYLTCHVLLELESASGRSLRELHEAMETDKAAVSRTVDCLVQDGLVTRRENPDDRRSVLIRLTATGRRKVEEINRHSDGKYRKLFGLIPVREHAAVLCAMSYLAGAFDELAGESVGRLPAGGRKP